MPTQRGSTIVAEREGENGGGDCTQRTTDKKTQKRPNLSRWDPGLPDLRRSRVGEREKRNRAGERE